MATGSKGNKNPAKQSPDQFNVRGTPRNEPGAGEYPNYTSWKDRAGNNWGADASEGNESMWFQHRSGTAIEMHPDGALHVTAHNSKYEITFGENRMTISGAQDITIKGDASLRVYGDYNVTCHKNYNLTVMGDYNFVAKNKNTHVRGNIDTQAKNFNTKAEGQYNTQAQGAMAMIAKGPVGMYSQSAQLYAFGAQGWHAGVGGKGTSTFTNEEGDHHEHYKNGVYNLIAEASGAAQNVGAAGADKKVTIQHKEGSTNITNSKDFKKKVEGDHSETTTGDHTVKSTTGNIQSKAMQGDISYRAMQGNVELKADMGDLHALAQAGTAALEGILGTHVGSNQGVTHVVGGGAGVNIDPLGGLLNLAGGLGIPFTGLGQLAFNFLDADQAQEAQDKKATRASQPQEEADASSWINALDRTA